MVARLSGLQAVRLEVVLQNRDSYDSGIQKEAVKVILEWDPVGEAFGGQGKSQWSHLLQTRPDRHFPSG